MPEFEPIMGRYFTMDVAGKPCRIYAEEAGEGIPLICLHTAGSDARQYRHLLCDKTVTDGYRCQGGTHWICMPCINNMVKRRANRKGLDSSSLC